MLKKRQSSNRSCCKKRRFPFVKIRFSALGGHGGLRGQCWCVCWWAIKRKSDTGTTWIVERERERARRRKPLGMRLTESYLQTMGIHFGTEHEESVPPPTHHVSRGDDSGVLGPTARLIELQHKLAVVQQRPASKKVTLTPANTTLN